MSVNELISRYEAEAEQIRGRMQELEDRARFLESVLTEIRGGGARSGRGRPAAGPAGGATRGPAAAESPAAPAKRRGRKPGGGGKRGGITAKDAILQVVSRSPEPMVAGDIIREAAAMGAGAPNSLRTQINSLKRAGLVEQIELPGRTFKYRIPSGR